MLEMHQLRQALGTTRQELSYTLYMQDAASRVIARHGPPGLLSSNLHVVWRTLGPVGLWHLGMGKPACGHGVCKGSRCIHSFMCKITVIWFAAD